MTAKYGHGKGNARRNISRDRGHSRAEFVVSRHFALYRIKCSQLHLKPLLRRKFAKTINPRAHSPQDEKYANEDLFRFTRNRFVTNEEREMSQRYIRFNIKKLGRIAAEAVGSESCTAIEKYPDGMHNKAYFLTMDGGKQVVAKVPNPNAGRPHCTTSSEVATMEFVALVSPQSLMIKSFGLACSHN